MQVSTYKYIENVLGNGNKNKFTSPHHSAQFHRYQQLPSAWYTVVKLTLSWSAGCWCVEVLTTSSLCMTPAGGGCQRGISGRPAQECSTQGQFNNQRQTYTVHEGPLGVILILNGLCKIILFLLIWSYVYIVQ